MSGPRKSTTKRTSFGFPKKAVINIVKTKQDFDLGKSALVNEDGKEINKEKQYSDVLIFVAEKSSNHNLVQDQTSKQDQEHHQESPDDQEYDFCPEMVKRVRKEIDFLQKENVVLKRRLLLCKRELEKAHKKDPKLSKASIPKN